MGKSCGTCKYFYYSDNTEPCKSCILTEMLPAWEPGENEEQQHCTNCLYFDCEPGEHPCVECDGEHWTPVPTKDDFSPEQLLEFSNEAVRNLTAENEQLQALLSKAHAENERLNSNLSGALEENRRLTNQLNGINRSHDCLEKAYFKAQEEIKSNHNALVAMQAKKDKHKKRAEQLEEENAKLKSNLSQTLDDKRRLSALRAEVTSLKEIYTDMENKADQKNVEMVLLSEDNAELRAEVEELKDDIRYWESRAYIENEHFRKAKEQLEDNAEVASLKEDIQYWQVEYSRIADAYDDLEEKLSTNSRNEEVDTLKEERQSLRDLVATLSKEMCVDGEQLLEKTATIEYLMEERGKAWDEIDRLTNEVKALKEIILKQVLDRYVGEV